MGGCREIFRPPPNFERMTEMKLEEAIGITKEVFALHVSTMGSTRFNEVLKSAGQLQEVAKALDECLVELEKIVDEDKAEKIN